MTNTTSSNAPWNQRYAKWDQFNDSDSEDEKEQRMKHPTQLDHSGDEDIVFDTTDLVSPAQKATVLKLELRPKEIWQLVVRKLRVWSAASDGDDQGVGAIPCRPYCILVNNLYPMGQVISKLICDPPEVYPSAATLLARLVQMMVSAPDGMLSHRPEKIVFPDKTTVGSLRTSLVTLGIECSYLSESEGINEYIASYSQLLVSQDVASIGDVSERPSVLSLVPLPLVRELYATAATFFTAQCWTSFSERYCIKLAVAGKDKAIYAAVLGGGTSGGINGLAIFYHRNDCSSRMMPSDATLASVTIPACRRCNTCDGYSDHLKKCTRCHRVWYCDATCQRADWPSHKTRCGKNTVSTNDVSTVIAKEVSLFYGDATSLPFDDLDAIETYGLMTPEAEAMKGSFSYPTFCHFQYGVPSVPEATDAWWLIRAAETFMALQTSAPTYFSSSMSHLIATPSPLKMDDDGDDGDDGGAERQDPPRQDTSLTLELPSQHTVTVTNATELTLQEYQLILQAQME